MPPTETGLLINSPLLGSTKLANAEAMKKIDPIMFTQAIHQGKERGRKLSRRPTAKMANTLATKNSVDPYRSGRHTRRSCCWTVTLCNSAAKVLMLKKIVPGNCVIAANQLRSCGSHAHNRTGARVCCESASTPVIAGVWACNSWANEAEVKKMEPTK